MTLVSWGCLKNVSVTCTDNDHLLYQNLKLDCIHKRDTFREPHVLIGTSINFGDEFGYFLPLPTILPLQYDIYPSDDSCSINNLPIKCKELICRFVGFDSFFKKCPLLRSFFLRNTCNRSDTLNVDQWIQTTNILNPESIHKLIRSDKNPLIIVSKHWSAISRRCLSYEWRRGACIEWKVFSDLMSNQHITKVAVDMKSKLVVLRERDIIVEGHLLDPTIAKVKTLL